MTRKQMEGYLIFAFGLLWVLATLIPSLSIGSSFILIACIPGAIIAYCGWRVAHSKPKIDAANDATWYQKWQKKHK
jgi:hypothetical protein